MLDTRSGQLLASQSFNDTFSNLQFTELGVSYLLHHSADPSQEFMELHHLDLTSKSDTLVTRFTHYFHTKVRPSLWRGNLSADSSVLVYQPDALVPSIAVLDGKHGTTISQIHSTPRWSDFTVCFNRRAFRTAGIGGY